MDNSNKTKPISKPHNKKPYRPTFNNNNPHNKLSLNKYHQIQDQRASQPKKSEGFKLHKRKRDLERMLKHCQEKGIEVDQAKKQELEEIEKQLGSRRKTYEKDKRKEFFLEQKYKNIKQIELRKVYKHLGETKANKQLSEEEKKKEIQEWEKKLRYIKHFPKTLKYISLFPTSKPLEQKTLEFQKKIMSDIQEQNSKRVARLNFYKSQNEIRGKKQTKTQNNQGKDTSTKKSSILPTTTRQFKTKDGKRTKKVVDDFFVHEESQNEKQERMDEEEQDSQESEIDEDVEIGDEDDQDDDGDEQDDDEE